MIIIVPSFETQNPWGISSAGRAPALHAGGQEFESPILQNLKIRAERLFFSAFYLLSCIRDFEKKYREFDMQVGKFLTKNTYY